MNVSTFLDELRALDIAVWADGDQLRCNAPSGALTAPILAQLQQQKEDILSFLHQASALAAQQRAIVPLQPEGARVPVFAVPGHNGDVFCYRALVSHLPKDQPFFGLQPPGLDGQSAPLRSVEDLASYFAAQIRAFRPQGACVIAGYCAGGTIAFELARQLVAHGRVVQFIALFGCPDPAWYRFFPQWAHRIGAQFARVDKHWRALRQRPLKAYAAYFTEKLAQRRAKRAADELAARHADPVMRLRERVEALTLAAVRRYRPGYFDGRIHTLFPSPVWARSRQGGLRWRARLAARFDEYCGPPGCTGDNLLREPYAGGTADLFRRCREANERVAEVLVQATVQSPVQTAPPVKPAHPLEPFGLGHP